MVTMYVITRQTTQSGTATDIIKVSGKDRDEALLNAKIKGYKAMENFKAEASMKNAFFGITDLVGGFVLIENWAREEVEAE